MRPGLLDLLLGVRRGVGEAVELGQAIGAPPCLLAEPVSISLSVNLSIPQSV